MLHILSSLGMSLATLGACGERHTCLRHPSEIEFSSLVEPVPCGPAAIVSAAANRWDARLAALVGSSSCLGIDDSLTDRYS